MRRFGSHAAWITFLVLGFSLLVIAPAGAYVDGGTASMVFQAIVGGIMAAGLTVGVFWRRITSFFRRSK